MFLRATATKYGELDDRSEDSNFLLLPCHEQLYTRCVIYEHEHEQPMIYEECVTLNNA